MHRVELKGFPPVCKPDLFLRFLMHRVELKADCASKVFEYNNSSVPNAPCGVESEEL
jgi:hypothetical protein